MPCVAKFSLPEETDDETPMTEDEKNRYRFSGLLILYDDDGNINWTSASRLSVNEQIGGYLNTVGLDLR